MSLLRDRFPLLLTVPIALAIASGVHAADGDTLWDPDGVEVGSGFLHTVASDEGGGAFIAWEGGGGVFVQLLDEDGVPQWTSPGVQVSTTGGNPAIVADSLPGAIAPGATVAWEESSGIYVQRIDYAGVVQWTSGGVQVATSGQNPVLTHIPGALGDPPGALIAWGSLARVAAVNGFGTVTAPGVNGISLGGGVSSPLRGNMRMISDEAGGAIVVWSDFSENIVAQRVNAGLPWGATPTVVSGDFRNEDRLDVAPDGAGGALISWSAIWFLPLEGQIRAQRIDSSGTSLWKVNGEVVVDSDVVGGDANFWTSSELRSSIDTDGSGGAILAWNDWRNEPGTGGGNDDVFAQRLSSVGTPLWTANGVLLPPFIVGSTAPGSQRFPRTVSDGKGGAVVTYQDLGGNSWDISATRLDSLGTKTFSNYVFTDFMGVDLDQTEPLIVFDGSGPSPVGAVIVWDDDRSGLDVRAQKVEIGPSNDDSGDAESVATGASSGTVLGASQDGSSSCGAGGDLDVWYVFTPPFAGTLEVDTCGSHDTGGVDAGMDTVVSLHSAAPGTTGNELACNDDWAFGGVPSGQCSASDAGQPRDSATSVFVSTTDPVWIRVANYPGSTPGDFDLDVRFIPEPGRWLLLTSGLGALAWLRRRSHDGS